jgi:hypothetical protein
MPSRTYSLFRNAIRSEQQVVCIYDGRIRELRVESIDVFRRQNGIDL